MRCIASLGDLQIFKKRKKVSVSSKLNVHNTLIKFASPAVRFFSKPTFKALSAFNSHLRLFFEGTIQDTKGQLLLQKKKKRKIEVDPHFFTLPREAPTLKLLHRQTVLMPPSSSLSSLFQNWSLKYDLRSDPPLLFPI